MSENSVDLCADLEEFVKKYKDDLLHSDKCELLCQLLTKRKVDISEQLNTENVNSEVVQTLNKVEEQLKETHNILEKAVTITQEIDENLDEYDEMRKQIQMKLDDLHFMQTKVQYYKIIKQINNLSKHLEIEYQSKDDEKCATLYLNICEVYQGMKDCSEATILLGFLQSSIKYWHEILKDKLSKDLDELLKCIKWPFVSANFSLASPSQTHIEKLQIVVEYLLEIELPESLLEANNQRGILADFKPVCLPVFYLIQPLKKRFLYHFYGARQTNRVDKPEWYFTQILSWIRDHVDFIDKWVQPIIDKLGFHHIDAKLEFMRGLVQLAVEKLNAEMPNFRYDDFTFSHSIDEGLGFDKELRETYFYPSTQPSILCVLTQGSVFNQWIRMEKKFALEKMDSMLKEDAFEAVNNNDNDHKISLCADTFITLLQTITERYESLPQPGHRLQFLELQIELLENFRIRLLQLVNAESGDLIDSNIPMIANTVYYIENVLLDWGAMVHFLGMFYYKTQLEQLENGNLDFMSPADEDLTPDFEGEDDNIFAETVSLYKHMRKDLLCTLAEQVMHQANVRSGHYCEERWSKMPSSKDIRSLSLTPSACPLFEVLAKRLHQLQKSLTPKLFTIVWRSLAANLDSYLFENLVMDNRFNDGGASQLKYDVTRNLFPLFAQFCEKPDNYFVQLKESCELLNISKGSALLLRETLIALEGATGVEDRRPQALKEIGVAFFTPQMSVKILNRRTDITVNRISID